MTGHESGLVETNPDHSTVVFENVFVELKQGVAGAPDQVRLGPG